MIKKITLNTILILLLQFFSCRAFAQTIPEKKFNKINQPIFLANGFFNLSAAAAFQNKAFTKNNLPDNATNNYFNNNQNIGNDAQIYLKSGIMLADQSKYGVVAKLEYNYNSSGANENLNLDQAFLYREDALGKFELGNNKAVNQQMKLGPARFARGAGGINGKYLEHINFSMLQNSANTNSAICNGNAQSFNCANIKLPSFIVLAQSPIGHGGFAQGNDKDSQFNRSRFRSIKDDSFDGVEDATKISYYTPRIKGVQIGLSYAPNAQDQGITANTNYNLSNIAIENIFSFGINYTENFDNIGVGFSATAEKGNAKNHNNNQVARHNLFAYDIATTITYFGFSFGASYGSWGKSLQERSGIYSCNYNPNIDLNNQNCLNYNAKFSDPKYYTLGIAYEFGPVATSLTGIKSQFQNNNYQALSFGLDYKYKKDLMPYIELTRFSFSSNQPQASNIISQTHLTNNQRQVKDNSGFVFLTGILFSF